MRAPSLICFEEGLGIFYITGYNTLPLISLNITFFWRIKSECKIFTTIKDELKAKLDKAVRLNLFNSDITRKRNIVNYKEGRASTLTIMEKSMLGISL